jgi:hypothetical protein
MTWCCSACVAVPVFILLYAYLLPFTLALPSFDLAGPCYAHLALTLTGTSSCLCSPVLVQTLDCVCTICMLV